MISAFRQRYSEFDQVTDGRVLLALDDAALEMSISVWGNLYERGLFALAAHLLFIGGALEEGEISSSDPFQSVASESVGNVSTSYASPSDGFSSNHGGLALTRYGQEYLRLLKLVSRHILVVR